MKKHTPVSLAEAFSILDRDLSREDKQFILQGEDTHFSLGLWIRNEWFYGADGTELELLAKDMEKRRNPEGVELESNMPFISFYTMNADIFSSELIDLYAKHLEMLGPEGL